MSGDTEDSNLLTEKTVSAFHLQAELARKIMDEQLERDKDPLSKKYERYRSGKKGKSQVLNDKVKGAGVVDWKDQKLNRLAFFENMKKLFLDKSQISKTFKNVHIDYEKLPEQLLDLEDNALPKNLTEFQINYIDEKGKEMEKEYLENGLSKEEVELRQKTYGPNALPEPKKTPKIILFLGEISSVFAILLWIAAILSFFSYGLDPSDMGNMWLGVVITVIILLTGMFSYIQNEKSSEVIESFKSFSATTVLVIREGNTVTIPATEIVKGDVVQVKTGEKVPADLRIFSIFGDLQFDNSPLTGESIAVSATKDCGEKGKENALEATNLAFFSTNCKEGRGIGVAIRIGSDTFMGKIADLASSAESGETTLQKEINHFIFIIAIVSIGTGLVFFILGLIVGYNIITNLIFSLGIVVANCPEGLISTVTVALAITAKKMLKRNIMVKNLQSVETLGSITCICSDKTGTLTKNKMTVVHMFYDAEIKKTSDSQKNLRNELNEEIPMSVYNDLDPSFFWFKFAGVCGSIGEFLTSTPEDYLPVIQDRNKYKKEHPEATNEEINEYIKKLREKYQQQYTEEYNKNVDERYTNTDASESGIIKFFEKIEPIDIIREDFPLHFADGNPVSIPFSSDLKYACYMRKSKEGNFILAMKGAPERILQRCSTFLLNGQELPITEAFKQKFNQANQAFALKGERVIGFAFLRLNPKKYPPDFEFKIEKMGKSSNRVQGSDPKVNFPLRDLCFVGMVAMEDPPRDGVKEAVAQCKNAGIKVIMVTGDQALTAASIAHQIGILSDLDDTPELIMRREKLSSLEEAEKKSNTIIIEGGRLQAMLDRDSVMSDDNPNKNSFLRNWLMKRDVVFARTSPENKLSIVAACQQLSHVVAVTGDGVNDSPAIKKADIGIAMGKVGTDVAKDAADILLLDDNFPNIIKGIKQGRVIFDILKKIIGYNMSSNMPELIPFMAYVIIQIPLPMSTILILCIDVGTDVLPNLTQSYEKPEGGLMNRQPRNCKVDKLCTAGLLAYGYFFTGVLETFACFLTYCIILKDYGYRPINLPFLGFQAGIEPAAQDYFNPYDTEFKGNSRAFMREYKDLLGLYGESREAYVNSKKRIPAWASDSDIHIDLRLFFPDKPNSFWGNCYWDSRGQNYDDYVCYRIEAVRHSQGAFLLSAVFMQFANSFNYRTKTASMFTHKLNNHYLHGSILCEFILVNIILFVPGLNTAFGTRPIRVEHYMITLAFHVTHFYWGELMKWMIRHSKRPDGSPGFFHQYFFY